MVKMLDVICQIADMKQVDYRTTLAVSTLIDLLVAKGIITRDEFARQAAELEDATMAEVLKARRMGE